MILAFDGNGFLKIIIVLEIALRRLYPVLKITILDAYKMGDFIYPTPQEIASNSIRNLERLNSFQTISALRLQEMDYSL